VVQSMKTLLVQSMKNGAEYRLHPVQSGYIAKLHYSQGAYNFMQSLSDRSEL